MTIFKVYSQKGNSFSFGGSYVGLDVGAVGADGVAYAGYVVIVYYSLHLTT